MMIKITVENSDGETESRRFVAPKYAKKFIANTKKNNRYKIVSIAGDGAEELKKEAGIA